MSASPHCWGCHEWGKGSGGAPPPPLTKSLCPPAPDYDTSDWTNEKEKLGLDFPNVGDGGHRG